MRSQMAATACLFLLLLCSVGFGSAQVDSKVCMETAGTASLPEMPSNFHAYMVTASQSGSLAGHVSIMVDANASRSAVTVENANTKEELKAVFDYVTGQILVIDNRADQFNIENCNVQNASADSSSTVMSKISFLGSERIIPNGRFFSGSGLNIVSTTEEVGGIPMTTYVTCHYSNSLQATLEVTWVYATSSQTPMHVKTRYLKKDESTIVDATYVLSPLRSLSSRHDATRHPLAAPRGVYCKGLVSAKKAPTTFNRFSVGVERYMYNLPGVDQGPDSFRESYDQRGNLTMIEGEGVSFTLDKSKYGSGPLARINDFTRGISYVKNIRYDNCTFEKIPDEDWDSNPSPNGVRIRTPDEFYFPSLSELQYKGSGVYRSADVDIYIGYKDLYLDMGDGTGIKYALSVEYYMDIKVSYDGTGNPSYKSIPLAAYSASNSKFYSLSDVFDFNMGVPRAYDHDISDCFSSTQKLHFELILSTSELDDSYVKYLSDYRNEFMYSLVSSLSQAINVSPLRIYEPTISLFAAPLVLVEITVSDRANVPGYTPKLPEAPLSQVVAVMTDLAGKGNLIVDVMEGDLVFQVPIKDFVIMDSRGSEAPAPGMSSGAIAGLCIGMILLGIVIGLAVVFGVGHFRKDPLFGFKPFGGETQQEA